LNVEADVDLITSTAHKAELQHKESTLLAHVCADWELTVSLQQERVKATVRMV